MNRDQITALSKNRVHINGNITGETLRYIGEVIYQKDQEGNPALTVHLSSAGGDVVPGLSICDLLEYYPGDTVGIVHGTASSMSAVILQCLKWRVATTHSQIHIHHVRISGLSIDVLRSRRKIEELRKLLEPDQKRLTKILMRRTGRSSTDISKVCRLDKPMLADEALKYRLLDQVIFREKDIKPPEKRLSRGRG